MRFFKMPNRIFEYKLSPKAVFVYAYLFSHKNVLHAITTSYKNIADNCHMDEKTAQKAVQELIGGNLIFKEARHNFRGKLKNKYWVTGLPGGWFKVEYQIFRTQMKSYDFMVYCYIKKHMDSTYQEAFPSLNAISSGTGISRSRVVASVQYLRRFTFINRVKRHYKRTRAYRHNRYLSFCFKSKEKRTRSHKRVLKKLNCLDAKFSPYVVIVEQKNRKVKLSFFCRGSPQIPNPL